MACYTQRVLAYTLYPPVSEMGTGTTNDASKTFGSCEQNYIEDLNRQIDDYCRSSFTHCTSREDPIQKTDSSSK